MTVCAAILGRRDVQCLNGKDAGATAIISGGLRQFIQAGDNRLEVAFPTYLASISTVMPAHSRPEDGVATLAYVAGIHA